MRSEGAGATLSRMGQRWGGQSAGVPRPLTSQEGHLLCSGPSSTSGPSQDCRLAKANRYFKPGCKREEKRDIFQGSME